MTNTIEEKKKEFYAKFISIPKVAHKNSPPIIFTTIDEVWQWIESLFQQVQKEAEEGCVKDLEGLFVIREKGYEGARIEPDEVKWQLLLRKYKYSTKEEGK